MKIHSLAASMLMNNQVHFPLSTKLTEASRQNGVPLSN